MGRGRAKAKQTKVARELKYNSPSTDLDRLRAELSSGPMGSSSSTDDDDEDDDSDADRTGHPSDDEDDTED